MLFRILRVSLRALARNKMRTFLTMLGIIIGVGAVIAMVSIGTGAKAAVEDRFAAMGTNLLFVSGASRQQAGRPFGLRRLSDADSRGRRRPSRRAVRRSRPPRRASAPGPRSFT